MIITPACADIRSGKVIARSGHRFELGPDLFCVFKVKARHSQLLRDPAENLPGGK
jgi:hypothetical protein